MERPSKTRMKTLTKDLSQSLRNPEFWAYSTWLALLTDYRQLRLGLAWTIISPLAYIFGLGYFYGGMLGGGENYYVHLGLGWSLWALTSKMANESTKIFSQHKAYILDGNTRLTDFVLRSMARGWFSFSFTFLVVLVLLVLDPSVHWLNMLTLLVTIPVLLFNLFWVGTVLALLGARFHDVREFIGTLLLFGFFLTPILWSAQNLPMGTMRGFLARMNPAFHFIEFVRAPVMGLPVANSSYMVVAGMTIAGWLVTILLYRRYARYVPLWI